MTDLFDILFILTLSAAGIGALVLAISSLRNVIRFRKSNLVTAKAYLSKVEQRRNIELVYTRKRIAFYTNSLYTYYTDGKRYSFEWGFTKKAHNIPNTITIVYPKNHPEDARYTRQIGVDIFLTVFFLLIFFCFLYIILYLGPH